MALLNAKGSVVTLAFRKRSRNEFHQLSIKNRMTSNHLPPGSCGVTGSLELAGSMSDEVRLSNSHSEDSPIYRDGGDVGQRVTR